LHFELLIDGFAGDGNIFRMEDDEIRLLCHLNKKIDRYKTYHGAGTKFLITKFLITKFLTHKVSNNKIPK
jgi:hypothetical protein